MTLRSSLDDLAGSAPGTDLLDLGLVRRRIARRRRVRYAAAGGAAVLTATTASVAGALVLTPDDDPADAPVAGPAESLPPTTDPVQHAFDYGECGEELPDRGPAPQAPLELTVELDASVNLHPGVQAPIGTATITNTSDETITGSSALAPDTWIVRDRTVVTEPGPQSAVAEHVSLAPGETATFEVYSFLRQCVPSETTQPRHEPLESGSYEVYVEWSMSTSGVTNAIALYSGPITLEIR